MPQRFQSFHEFYPFYLSEHRNPVCRRLHNIGSLLVIGLLVTTIVTRQWILLAGLPVVGYGFAWAGHFFFEKNKPATLQYPFYSFIADWVMLWETLCRF